MLFRILLIGFFLVPLNSIFAQDYFYSPAAHEATLEFDFSVYFQSEENYIQESANRNIEAQVKYLFAAMTHNNRLASPKLTHEISNISISKMSEATYRADYHFAGKVVVQDGSSKYDFFLPLNPSNVYRKSFVSTSGISQNPCGDAQHSEQTYYWYFFNPKAYGCPLIENQDFAKVTGALSPFKSTTQTYPEYQRLKNESGEIRVDVLFGMNDESLDVNVARSTDINAVSIRKLRQTLLAANMKSQIWSNSETDLFLKGRNFSKYPYVETFTFTQNGTTLSIRIFFGPSSLFNGEGFHAFLADAVSNASAVIYAGHSGLGEYLDIAKIWRASGVEIAPNRDKYQIYFFNGCSSYPYYSDQYFSTKQSASDPNGTKNLDILTNGMSTFFSAIPNSNKALIDALVDYAKTGKQRSYQQIIDDANSGNLVNIIGDEDNSN